MALLAEAAPVFYTLLLVTAIMCFLVGTCWLFIAFLKDIKNDVSLLNVSETSDDRLEIVAERFCTIIQRFLDITQLSYKFHRLF